MSQRAAAILLIAVVSAAVVGASLASSTKSMPVAERGINQNSCSDLSLQQRFQTADLIMTGSVFAVIPNVDETADVLITTEKVLKGTAPDIGVTLAARPTSLSPSAGTSNDLHFTSDDPPYLLVLRQRLDGRYNTSACDGTRSLDGGLTGDENSALETLAP